MAYTRALLIRAYLSGPTCVLRNFAKWFVTFLTEKQHKHLCSQSRFLVYEGKPIVPFIGRIEQMAADWSRLLQQLGLDEELPRINRTGKKGEHYSHFYKDDAIIKLVGDRYAEDIRYFGYDFTRQ